MMAVIIKQCLQLTDEVGLADELADTVGFPVDPLLLATLLDETLK